MWSLGRLEQEYANDDFWYYPITPGSHNAREGHIIETSLQLVSRRTYPLYAATGPNVRGTDFYEPSGFVELRGYPKKVVSNARSKNHELDEKY